MASSDRTAEEKEALERLRGWLLRRRGAALPGEDRSGAAITLCILIAVVLWFTLSLRESYTMLQDLPTEVVNLPAEQALTALPPPRVQVQVRGEGLALFGLRFNPPSVPIDARQDQVSLANQLFDLPNGIIVENVSPLVFNLPKEPRLHRKIPIRLRADIEPSGSHDLIEPPRLEPDSVVVSGARSIVEELPAWPTVFFEEHGLLDSLVVRLALSDTLNGLVTRDVDATTLTVVARPFTEGVRLLTVELTGVQTSERVVTLEPPRVEVTYRVPLSQYEQAQNAADFFATVSYDAIRTDTTGRVRPDVHLPEGITFAGWEVRPSTLRYYERLVEQ